MTKKDISEAVSNVSDRHIGEVADFITESEVNEMKKTEINKKSLMKYAMAAACFIVCVLSAIGISKSNLFKRPEPTSNQPSFTQDTLATSTTAEVSEPTYSLNNAEPSDENIFPSVAEESTSRLVEDSTSQLTTDNGSSGGDSGSEGARESFSKAVATGVGFSEDEIENYINKNSGNILQVVQSEYSFEIKTLSVNKKGYCHASCDNDNKVNLDYITLPILVNGEIYASITLMKAAEDEIIETVNIGGDTWKKYNSVISENPEADIVFAFLPNAMGEIMILPDNTAVNPVDGKLQSPIAALNPDINWYNLLKTEYNTINYEQLLSAENNIAIIF